MPDNVTYQDPVDLAEASQIDVPAKAIRKYRPKSILYDWPNGRMVVTWETGYMDGSTFVPVFTDSHTFRGDSWETVRTHAVTTNLLAALQAFLRNQGKL